MNTSWKPFGRSLRSYSTVKNGQQSLLGRERERALRMMDGLTAPKMPNADENVKDRIMTHFCISA